MTVVVDKMATQIPWFLEDRESFHCGAHDFSLGAHDTLLVIGGVSDHPEDPTYAFDKVGACIDAADKSKTLVTTRRARTASQPNSQITMNLFCPETWEALPAKKISAVVITAPVLSNSYYSSGGQLVPPAEQRQCVREFIRFLKKQVLPPENLHAIGLITSSGGREAVGTAANGLKCVSARSKLAENAGDRFRFEQELAEEEGVKLIFVGGLWNVMNQRLAKQTAMRVRAQGLEAQNVSVAWTHPGDLAMNVLALMQPSAFNSEPVAITDDPPFDFHETFMNAANASFTPNSKILIRSSRLPFQGPRASSLLAQLLNTA